MLPDSVKSVTLSVDGVESRVEVYPVPGGFCFSVSDYGGSAGFFVAFGGVPYPSVDEAVAAATLCVEDPEFPMFDELYSEYPMIVD